MIQAKKNYKTKKISNEERLVVRLLYNSMMGRLILKIIIRPSISKMFGRLMNFSASRVLIRKFIEKNNIDMNEYPSINYKSFNDFFTRKIKEECRTFFDNSQDIVAPCDGKMTVYPITCDADFYIKGSIYTIESMLEDKLLAHEFEGGVCLIFRLTPDDYHRYSYIDNGEIISRKKIKGVLHTVRPIAQRRHKIFMQNTREYEVLQTENFDKVIQMEVGALFVGRISNHERVCKFKRGDEKGMFEFGGSTIIMLFRKNRVVIDDSICMNTRNYKETIVKMGTTIGKRYS